MHTTLINDLRNRLNEKLPAHSAHQKVMSHRKSVVEIDETIETARQSAVLILLYPKNKRLHTVFIQRPTYEGVHSGQIAFPGGKAEKFDVNIEATALREANEELNINSKEVELIGKLTPIYVPPSNFLIHPFIGYQNERPNFIPEVAEVAAVLECPLDELMGEEKLISSEVVVRGGVMQVKGFSLNNQIIWGATGMITKEFLEVLEEITL